jgi:L-gulono-1,4-lactone dehydrogenase
VSTSKQTLHPFAGREWCEFARVLERARIALRSPPSGAMRSRSFDADAALWLAGYPWCNWARNQNAMPTARPQPNSESAVICEIKAARLAGKKVRVLGRGYSFSPLVPTPDHMLDVTPMNACSVDRTTKTVTAGPGTTIADLDQALAQKNLCLETAPVIPWITIGGALGTGVHGTGSNYGTLADLVVEARVVDASGQVHVVNGPRGANLTDEGRALGCNLGALGVITEVTFQAVDLFNLEAKDDTRNYWLETTMLSRDGLRSLLKEAPYVSALWWPATERCWVKKWKPTSAQPTMLDVQYFLDQLGGWLGAGVVTEVGQVLGDHPEWTPMFTALVFDEIRHQEYVLQAPRVFHFITKYPMVWNMSFAFDVEGYSDAGVDRAVSAWQKLVDILECYRSKGLFPQNMAAHMRHIHSSNSLLSPSTGHNGSVALEIVTLQGQKEKVWSEFFGKVETAWLGLSGRPHWGKVHGWGDAGGEPTIPSQLATIRGLYPSSNRTAFRNVRQAWDPQGLFQNPYTAALQI